MSIIVTGATGQLGRHVIEGLLEMLPAEQVTAVVRSKDKGKILAERGVKIAIADYNVPDSFETLFSAGDKVLLVSSSEFHQDRVKQHRMVLDAAKAAGVALFAYTSAPGTLTGPITVDHRQTEDAIRKSGVPYVLLRNAWYSENFTERLAPVLHYKAVTQAAAEGRVASASRADLAAAAVEVLVTGGHENKTYELTGDAAWSFAEFADELSRQTGASIVYNSVSAEEYMGILTSPAAGIPAPMASILTSVETSIANGELAATSSVLSGLIGRPTTPIAHSIAAALN